MTANSAEYVGLDVGGTFLKGARIDETGRVLSRLHDPIRKESRDALLAQFAGAVKTLEQDVPPTSSPTYSAVLAVIRALGRSWRPESGENREPGRGAVLEVEA